MVAGPEVVGPSCVARGCGRGGSGRAAPGRRGARGCAGSSAEVLGERDVCMNVTCVSDEPRHAGRATPVTYWGPGPLGDPLQVAP